MFIFVVMDRKNVGKMLQKLFGWTSAPCAHVISSSSVSKWLFFDNRTPVVLAIRGCAKWFYLFLLVQFAKYIMPILIATFM